MSDGGRVRDKQGRAVIEIPGESDRERRVDGLVGSDEGGVLVGENGKRAVGEGSRSDSRPTQKQDIIDIPKDLVLRISVETQLEIGSAIKGGEIEELSGPERSRVGVGSDIGPLDAVGRELEKADVGGRGHVKGGSEAQLRVDERREVDGNGSERTGLTPASETKPRVRRAMENGIIERPAVRSGPESGALFHIVLESSAGNAERLELIAREGGSGGSDRDFGFELSSRAKVAEEDLDGDESERLRSGREEHMVIEQRAVKDEV
jgi:hypothetical protein